MRSFGVLYIYIYIYTYIRTYVHVRARRKIEKGSTHSNLHVVSGFLVRLVKWRLLRDTTVYRPCWFN